MMMPEIVLKAEHIDKSFGPTHASNDISIEVAAGEIRGLAGENGSGKSTLASIICGIISSDSGKMWIKGKEYEPKNAIDANRKGVSMVVQELGVVTGLSAAQNMFLGRMDKFKRHGFINNRVLNDAAKAELKKWGFSTIDVGRMARQLTIEDRKIVELARALSTDPDLIILDEITQTLSHDRREELYVLIQKLKQQGKAILLISHDLEEMFGLMSRFRSN